MFLARSAHNQTDSSFLTNPQSTVLQCGLEAAGSTVEQGGGVPAVANFPRSQLDICGFLVM